MIRTLVPALALAAIGMSTVVASAFSPLTESSREYELLAALLPDRVANLQSQVVDIDGDGTAEIAAKLDCPDISATCRTLIFHFTQDRWEKIFDSVTGDIEFTKAKFGRMQDVVTANGTWSWNGVRYVFAPGETGTAADFQPAPTQYQSMLASQFGAGAARLVESGDARITIAMVSPEENTEAVVARIDGDGVCGIKVGCPTKVLMIENGAYRTIMSGAGRGSFALSGSNRGGWSDIAMERPDGSIALYGWTGENYVAAGN